MHIKEPLAWVDLEMTGLSVETDYILEAAIIITDGNLNIIAEGPHLIIYQSDTILDAMNPWCVKQHHDSGLTAAVKKSTYTIEQVDHLFTEFIAHYCPKQSALLTGNSIWQDRLFVQKYMPQFSHYLHYKMIDVTSIQQLVKRWYPHDARIKFKKQEMHRALDDIKESIAELVYYKNIFWIK